MNSMALQVTALTAMTMACSAPKAAQSSLVRSVVLAEEHKALATAPSPPPSRESRVLCVARFIRETTPRLAAVPREAERISRLIVDAALAHDLDPLLVAAIVRHESLDFRSGRQSCNGPRGCDLGLGQVNEVWVHELDLDAKRLQHDDRYNLRVTARLLARARVGHEHEPRWWSRFHDGRPSRRARYEQMVLPLIQRATEEVVMLASAGTHSAGVGVATGQ